jgi:hypothetical protein
MVTGLHRPLERPTLIVTGDRKGPDGFETDAKLWRVPFAGWGAVYELRAAARCVPRRFVVVDADGLTRAAGYTATPTLWSGEPFR